MATDIQKSKAGHNTAYHAAPAEETDNGEAENTTTSWTPGIWRQLPWLGLSAALLALLTIGAMVAVVFVSDNKPVSDWQVQPSVILAIIAAAANILISYALSEALTIAWWVKSLGPNAHLQDLHNYWAFGSSKKDAIFAGKSFNMVALAALFAATVPVNGPLLQRATGIGQFTASSSATVAIPIALEIPPGYSGLVTGRTVGNVSATTGQFNAVIKDLAKPLNVSGDGCDGTCSMLIDAAGYDMACANSAEPFVLNPQTINGNVVQNFDPQLIFSTIFDYNENDQSVINFTAKYKSTDSCVGSLNVVNCTLRPAVMRYHALMTNRTITLDPSYRYKDDKVVRLTLPSMPGYQTGMQYSTHGGVALYLNQLYDATATLTWNGAVGYRLTTDGAPANYYSMGDYLGSNCSVKWSDPTDDMLTTARDLAFRISVLSANATNATNTQQVTADRRLDVIVYKSHYEYLWAAIALSLTAIFLIVPLFHGFWLLGRTTSMSPLEIAKAFDAPLLREADSNADGKVLLKAVGNLPVEYAKGENPGQMTMRRAS